MKKYAITLLALILIGLGLTVLLFSQDEKLDETVFLETTESIRNLQNLDKNLLVLLSQSRFNSEFDHEILTETSYELSEEFSNLRYEALFEEIEASQALSSAIKAFDESYASREEELEIYIETNSAVSWALNALPSITEAVQSISSDNQPNKKNEQLGKINAQIFSKTFGGASLNKAAILEQLNLLISDEGNESQMPLEDYESTIRAIIDNMDDAESSFNTLSARETGPLLDAIEKEYVNHHNQAISGANQFSLALILYGVVLLAALIFFAAQIRRNFLFLEQEVADRTDEIKTAYEDLQESQEQLIQSEKMASLGQMVAGVAHEINTPLGYVSSNTETLKLNMSDISQVMNELGVLMSKVATKDRDNKKISQQLLRTLTRYKDLEAQELMNESNQLLEDGTYGLTEMSKLVASLKDFARLDRQTSEQIDIHDCIESSLTIASNHIRENEVTIVRDFDELPKITCIPSKLNQLFLNIITNACQAMSGTGGTLTVKTQLEGEKIHLQFSDQGIGMDEATVQKMFDPFFTTKEIGVGTGLGMSIAYKIIEAHDGAIDVRSELGKGTSLSIALPITNIGI